MQSIVENFAFLAVTLLYAATLFVVAWWGDRRSVLGPLVPSASRRAALLFVLTVAIYNTSWSFYGSVGRAASSGWDFLPIYIGPVLVLVFWQGLLRRVVRLTKGQNLTSIADFIAARYGKSGPVATAVTLMATLGVLPYIALQLKAVGASFDVLAGTSEGQASTPLVDTAGWTAVALAVFAIFFGVRHVNASEHHRGLMLAVAFESLVKLGCFVAVGAFIVYGLNEGPLTLLAAGAAHPEWGKLLEVDLGHPGWLSNTLISALAFLCLPQAYHVVAVEADTPDHLAAARWLYPAYLALLSVLMLPIALAGRLAFGASVNPDTYMITLPLHGGAAGASLLSFLGGLSAATGMVVVAALALATMLCNDVVLPLMLRIRRGSGGDSYPGDIGSLLILVRRCLVVLVVLLAYVMERLVGQGLPLTQIGLVSFVAIAQFGPAFLGGLTWQRAHRAGVLAGLCCGFLMWVWCLLVPAAAHALPSLSGIASAGPFGISALRPYALMGVEGLDPISHATLWSLGLNLAAFVLGSLLGRPTAVDRAQARLFVTGVDDGPAERPWRAVLRMDELQGLASRVVGAQTAAVAFAQFEATRAGREGAGFADGQALRFTENLVAGAVGAASARVLVASSLEGRHLSRAAAMAMLDEASALIRFNRRLLETTLENVSHGIVAVDSEMRLSAWNTRFLHLLQLPHDLVKVGTPLRDIVSFTSARGETIDDQWKAFVTDQDVTIIAWPYTYVRYRPDGTVLEATWNRLPEGGFVATITDITERERAAAALAEAKEQLEERVRKRTRELEVAKREADAANASKSRFLAAAGHDMMQPLHAARLFASALERETQGTGRAADIARHLAASLQSADALVTTLLDVSALESGGIKPSIQAMPIGGLLAQLETEFAALAAEKGLRLRVVPSSLTVISDPKLLRRVLQNLVSNAIRYTPRGKIVVGCRRKGPVLRVAVWDQGLGIPADMREQVFEEFQRLDHDTQGRGHGLGLAIVRRIAAVLGHAVTLDSWPGRGSVFAVELPLTTASSAQQQPSVHRYQRTASFEGLLVLCIDDDEATRTAVRALIESWGGRCAVGADRSEALAALAGAVPEVVLVDFHLRKGTGLVDLAALRRQWRARVPAVVVSADRSDAARREAREHGSDILHKPVRPAALRTVLQKLARAGRDSFKGDST